jgi:hypothetical protein
LFIDEIEKSEDDYYKVFGTLLRAAIAASAKAGPDSPEAKHANECVRKDYETRFKNDDIIEALKKAYDVGFRKGFRMAKIEDMPWWTKEGYEKEMKELEKKQQLQQHPLKQLYSRYSSNNNKKQADD